MGDKWKGQVTRIPGLHLRGLGVWVRYSNGVVVKDVPEDRTVHGVVLTHTGEKEKPNKAVRRVEMLTCWEGGCKRGVCRKAWWRVRTQTLCARRRVNGSEKINVKCC